MYTSTKICQMNVNPGIFFVVCIDVLFIVCIDVLFVVCIGVLTLYVLNISEGT